MTTPAFIARLDKRLPDFERWLLRLLQISVGVIFVWFGALKVAGYDPVHDILAASFPFLADPPGLVVLGILEVAIGVALLFDILLMFASIVLVGHLLGTFSVFLLAPHLMFDPVFPVLTPEGEFVVKNVTLIVIGLLILVRERRADLARKASQPAISS